MNQHLEEQGHHQIKHARPNRKRTHLLLWDKVISNHFGLAEQTGRKGSMAPVPVPQKGLPKAVWAPDPKLIGNELSDDTLDSQLRAKGKR